MEKIANQALQQQPVEQQGNDEVSTLGRFAREVYEVYKAGAYVDPNFAPVIKNQRIALKPEYDSALPEFQSALKELTIDSQQENGNIAFELYKDTLHPDNFMITEKWANPAALETHLRQPYLAEFYRRYGAIFTRDSSNWTQL